MAEEHNFKEYPPEKPIISAINHKTLKPSESSTFYITGHVYGHPTTSALDNHLDRLNKQHVDFVLVLGDIFNTPLPNKQTRIKPYNKFLAPMFNAVGNHDIASRDSSQREHYVKHYGPSVYSFVHGRNLFIVTDTEMPPEAFNTTQLPFIQQQITKQQTSDTIKNIFICSHRPLWLVNNPLNGELATMTNDTFFINNLSKYAVEAYADILKQAQRSKKRFFFISGDVGYPHAIDLYHETENNITYIATGLGDRQRDKLLKAVSDNKGNVVFEVISLCTEAALPLRHYNKERSKKHLTNPAKNNLLFGGLMALIMISTLIVMYQVKRRQAPKKSGPS